MNKMDETHKELITKLDTFFGKKGLNTDDIILLLSDMSYLYKMCRLSNKDITDIIEDLEQVEDYMDDDDDFEDDEDDLLEEEAPTPAPSPAPAKPNPTQQLKQQLGKPLAVKQPKINVRQDDVDKGNY